MDYYKQIVYLILAIVLLWAVSFLTLGVKTPENGNEGYITLSECFIESPNIPYIPTTYVLGTLVDEELYRIIDCESDFRPDVCSYAGCGSGMGLCQIIPKTLKYCEEKLNRKLDVFDPADNIECGEWLLENEGNQHWDMSRHCWDK